MGTTKPLFVSFEGVEGVGKTTAMSLFADLLDEQDIAYVRNREPGGTPVAEALREIVLGEHDEPLTDTTELLLMFAARAQSVAEVIRPALAQGSWVLCDRFTDATLAYQGFARGMPRERIDMLADWVHSDLWPDATIWLHAPPAVTEQRMSGRGRDKDRIEQQPADFFAAAADGYARLAQANPERYFQVETSAGIDVVKARLADVLDALLARSVARQ
ncbi:MAG: dTMP kinase [Pseudomonadota bacterium]